MTSDFFPQFLNIPKLSTIRYEEEIHGLLCSYARSVSMLIMVDSRCDTADTLSNLATSIKLISAASPQLHTLILKFKYFSTLASDRAGSALVFAAMSGLRLPAFESHPLTLK